MKREHTCRMLELPYAHNRTSDTLISAWRSNTAVFSSNQTANLLHMFLLHLQTCRMPLGTNYCYNPLRRRLVAYTTLPLPVGVSATLGRPVPIRKLTGSADVPRETWLSRQV